MSSKFSEVFCSPVLLKGENICIAKICSLGVYFVSSCFVIIKTDSHFCLYFWVGARLVCDPGFPGPYNVFRFKKMGADNISHHGHIIDESIIEENSASLGQDMIETCLYRYQISKNLILFGPDSVKPQEELKEVFSFQKWCRGEQKSIWVGMLYRDTDICVMK